MIKEIEKRLADGEVVELECVDLNKFLTEELNCKTRYNKKCMAEFNSLVDEASDVGVTMEDGFFIDEEELKYFRIVEAKPTNITSHTHKGVTSGVETNQTKDSPTFDDLIDVAIQAYKDGVLKSLKLLDYGVHSLSYSIDADVNGDENTIFSQHKDYSDGIDFINSLYTETFVIESEEDMRKMRIESKGVLPNGLEFKVTDTAVKMFYGENDLAITVNFNGMDHNELLYLSPLKGATVTQKRGK